MKEISPTKVSSWPLIPLLILGLLYSISLHTQSRFEYEYQQMGTQIRLVFYAKDEVLADSLAQAVYTRLEELNDKFSDFKSDSELNRLCAHGQKEVMVSQDLFKVLQQSVAISRRTGGAFDISAGPLVKVWREARKIGMLPSVMAIKRAKNLTGYKAIAFPSHRTVVLEQLGMQLDLGGIGKGFAADETLKVIESFGVSSALIDMGGDIRVGDAPPNRKHWTISLAYSNAVGNEVIYKIGLKNQAVATSGDHYQFMEVEGVRYSHIIDPISGMALTNGIQVTVIAPTATMADAYASACSVMGITRSRTAAPNWGSLEFCIVENGSDGFQIWTTTGFEQLLLQAK